MDYERYFERTVDGVLQETKFEFNSREQILLRAEDAEEQVKRAIARLLVLIQEMTERESDLVVKQVYCTTLRRTKYNPLGGSSYIRSPEKIAWLQNRMP